LTGVFAYSLWRGPESPRIELPPASVDVASIYDWRRARPANAGRGRYLISVRSDDPGMPDAQAYFYAVVRPGA